VSPTVAPTSVDGPKPALQSVTIALAILDQLSESPALSLSDLARRVGVAKSTAHRTCSVLVSAGLLSRAADSSYRLGLKLIEYGHLAAARTPVGEHALPLLVDLRSTLGETVQVGVAVGADVVYVERVEGVKALRYRSGNSHRGPVHRSSAGKVLAAFVPGVLEARLAEGLPRSTGYTIVVPAVLRAEISQVRDRGYARSVEETSIGRSSLAVPVRSSADGPVVAALSMIGPTSRVIGDVEAHHLHALRTAAARLSAALERGEYRLPPRRP
jgi:DNA-binding IclR family transcriptional regulator